MLAADLDGDGDMDLLSVSRDQGRILWHENLLIDAATAPPGMTSPEAPDDVSSLAPSTTDGKKNVVLEHETIVHLSMYHGHVSKLPRSGRGQRSSGPTAAVKVSSAPFQCRPALTNTSACGNRQYFPSWSTIFP